VPTTTAAPTIPELLLEVMRLMRFEEVRREQGDPFRCWCSPDLVMRVYVHERPEDPGRPCCVNAADSCRTPRHVWCSFAEALELLSRRPEYREALLGLYAS
jgi:hypothetical protein